MTALPIADPSTPRLTSGAGGHGAPAGRRAPAGSVLREWRERRRLSQLNLALTAGVSTRHLSYVENGRARPSRDMILRLTDVLDVPLRDVNSVLLGAGHAPAYADARTDAAATRRLLETLDLTLAAVEPWPALVLDSAFDVVTANRPVDLLLGLCDPDVLDPPVNVVRATLHPRGLSRYIVNLPEWRSHLLRQVIRHAAAAPSADFDELLREAVGWSDPGDSSPPAADPTFALTLQLRMGATDLHFYSTVATFGTPLDVAASELAIETFIPADDRTRSWLDAQALDDDPR